MTAIEEPGYLPFNVQAKANYNARGDNEINLIAGNQYVVVATDKKGLWWKAQDATKGHTAWFPAAYTTVLPRGGNLPTPSQVPRPDSSKTTLVQPAIVNKTPSQVLPQPQHTQPLPQPNPRPTPQQPLPTLQQQQPLPNPQQPLPPQRNLPQPTNNKPVPQVPHSQPLPSQPQVAQRPSSSSGLPQPLPTPQPSLNTISKDKLDVNSFTVVGTTEKPPQPLQKKTHKEEGTFNFLKLQLVECKDLKVDKNGTPTAFIVHKNPYEKGTQGTVILTSETLKSQNPAFNELFMIDVADPEMSQILIRFANGKKHLTQGGGKAYIGEIKIELRAAVRQDFNSPNSQFKWFPIKNGEEKTGEAKLYLEFTDLREKTSKGPTNVKHHGHIGVVNGVFSADNLPPEWKEQLKQAGVRKKDLNSPELRDLLFGLILDAGGKVDPEDSGASVNNNNNTSSKSSPLPQPSLPSHPQQPLPQLNPRPTPQQPLPTPTKTTPTPQPTPTLPPQRPMPQTTASDDAPMMRGTPPPIKNTATNSTEQPTGRAPRGPRGPATNLGSSHKAESDDHHEEKPTAVVRKEPTQPALPGTGDLLAEIAKGKQLRSVADREVDSKQTPQGGLAGALSAALEANRIALGGALDDGSDGSDWD